MSHRSFKKLLVAVCDSDKETEELELSVYIILQFYIPGPLLRIYLWSVVSSENLCLL